MSLVLNVESDRISIISVKYYMLRSPEVIVKL